MNAALSANDLLEALTRLPEREFQSIFCRASVRRHPPKTVLAERESELLMLINEPAPAEWKLELGKLRDLGGERYLTADEEKELDAVVARLENHSVTRLRHLIELAGIRDVSLTELMNSLGLKLPANA